MSVPGSVEAAVDDPGLRGHLELRTRAVERLVAAAAAEVDEVGGSVSRLLGQQVGSADPGGRPQVAVTVAGDLVTVEVDLSVRWPSSVPEVADRLRDRIRERLAEQADLRVGHVDVNVTALPTGRRHRRRVG